MKPFRFLPGLFCAGVLFLGRGEARAQSLLSEYTFNDAGVTAANAVGGGAAMSLYNGTGVATDTRAAGVSGAAGDSAWDGHDYNAGGMSTVGAYGLVTGGSSIFNGLTSFTITGWFDASTSTGSGAGTARLFASSKVALQFLGGTTGLSFSVNGTAVSPSNGAAYDNTGNWTFVAVSYDSTLNQVSFYAGTKTSAVTLVGTTTLNAGAVASSTGDLYFGNRGTTTTTTNGVNDRTFDGLLDDFRVYSGTFGAGSAADTGLDTVRASALAVPEPGAAPLLLPAGVLGMFWGLRRRFPLFS